jgi:ribonuclease BN (tRNA processing enzyme)
MMRLTVLGGCGAWPEAGQACSGFLVEHDGFRLVVDLGYATVPRLLERAAPGQVDAVFISHGHPDHCVDLNPLLRARVLREDPAAALPVYALPGALDAVLALDRPEMLAGALELTELSPGGRLEIGPFQARTRLLPHSVPNVGVRLAAGEAALAYTGDCGPSPLIAELALQADLLLAEASYVDLVPEDSRGYLSSASQAGRRASQAGAGRLLLTHLLPGTDPVAARGAAAGHYRGDVGVAVPGLVLDLP